MPERMDQYNYPPEDSPFVDTELGEAQVPRHWTQGIRYREDEAGWPVLAKCPRDITVVPYRNVWTTEDGEGEPLDVPYHAQGEAFTSVTGYGEDMATSPYSYADLRKEWYRLMRIWTRVLQIVVGQPGYKTVLYGDNGSINWTWLRSFRAFGSGTSISLRWDQPGETHGFGFHVTGTVVQAYSPNHDGAPEHLNEDGEPVGYTTGVGKGLMIGQAVTDGQRTAFIHAVTPHADWQGASLTLSNAIHPYKAGPIGGAVYIDVFAETTSGPTMPRIREDRSLFYERKSLTTADWDAPITLSSGVISLPVLSTYGPGGKTGQGNFEVLVTYGGAVTYDQASSISSGFPGPDARLVVANDGSTLDLSGHADMVGATSVEIVYWEPVADQANPPADNCDRFGQASCAHCVWNHADAGLAGIPDVPETSLFTAFSTAANGGSYHCSQFRSSEMNGDEWKGAEEPCINTACPHFSEYRASPSDDREIRDFLRQIWAGKGVYYRQPFLLAGGNSLRTVGRQNQTGLFEMMGFPTGRYTKGLLGVTLFMAHQDFLQEGVMRKRLADAEDPTGWVFHNYADVWDRGVVRDDANTYLADLTAGAAVSKPDAIDWGAGFIEDWFGVSRAGGADVGGGPGLSGVWPVQRRAKDTVVVSPKFTTDAPEVFNDTGVVVEVVNPSSTPFAHNVVFRVGRWLESNEQHAPSWYRRNDSKGSHELYAVTVVGSVAYLDFMVERQRLAAPPTPYVAQTVTSVDFFVGGNVVALSVADELFNPTTSGRTVGDRMNKAMPGDRVRFPGIAGLEDVGLVVRTAHPLAGEAVTTGDRTLTEIVSGEATIPGAWMPLLTGLEAPEPFRARQLQAVDGWVWPAGVTSTTEPPETYGDHPTYGNAALIRPPAPYGGSSTVPYSANYASAFAWNRRQWPYLRFDPETDGGGLVVGIGDIVIGHFYAAQAIKYYLYWKQTGEEDLQFLRYRLTYNLDSEYASGDWGVPIEEANWVEVAYLAQDGELAVPHIVLEEDVLGTNGFADLNFFIDRDGEWVPFADVGLVITHAAATTTTVTEDFGYLTPRTFTIPARLQLPDTGQMLSWTDNDGRACLSMPRELWGQTIRWTTTSTYQRTITVTDFSGGGAPPGVPEWTLSRHLHCDRLVVSLEGASGQRIMDWIGDYGAGTLVGQDALIEWGAVAPPATQPVVNVIDYGADPPTVSADVASSGHWDPARGEFHAEASALGLAAGREYSLAISYKAYDMVSATRAREVTYVTNLLLEVMRKRWANIGTKITSGGLQISCGATYTAYPGRMLPPDYEETRSFSNGDCTNLYLGTDDWYVSTGGTPGTKGGSGLTYPYGIYLAGSATLGVKYLSEGFRFRADEISQALVRVSVNDARRVRHVHEFETGGVQWRTTEYTETTSFDISVTGGFIRVNDDGTVSLGASGSIPSVGVTVTDDGTGTAQGWADATAILKYLAEASPPSGGYRPVFIIGEAGVLGMSPLDLANQGSIAMAIEGDGVSPFEWVDGSGYKESIAIEWSSINFGSVYIKLSPEGVLANLPQIPWNDAGVETGLYIPD